MRATPSTTSSTLWKGNRRHRRAASSVAGGIGSRNPARKVTTFESFAGQFVEPRLTRAALEGHVDGMRHLCRQLVEREHREHAEDARGIRVATVTRSACASGSSDASRYSPPGDDLNEASVTHGVERPAIDAEAQRFGHAEAAAMPAEQLDLPLEGWGAHRDILPSNFYDVKAICPYPSGRSIAQPLQHGPRKRRLVTNVEERTVVRFHAAMLVNRAIIASGSRN